MLRQDSSDVMPSRATTRNRPDVLVALGKLLQSKNYHFTTITPASHHRVMARDPCYEGTSLTDIFGWSYCFRRYGFEDVIDMLAEAGELKRCGELFRSKV